MPTLTLIDTGSFTDHAQDDVTVIKADLIEGLGHVQSGGESIKPAVRRALAAGVHWRTLLAWATEAGYKQGYARQTLGQVLRELGIRRRKRGAGHKIPPRALQILAEIERMDGELAEKLLLAAYRAAKSRRLSRQERGAEPAEGRSSPEPAESASLKCDTLSAALDPTYFTGSAHGRAVATA
jgi:hypothetical protein